MITETDASNAAAVVEQLASVPAPLFRAKLDHDGIYWGPELVDSIGADDVQVPGNCDLRLGAYRWNADAKTFDALPPSQVKKTETAPSIEEAFAELLHMTPNLGPRAQAWLDAFNKSIDAQGAG